MNIFEILKQRKNTLKANNCIIAKKIKKKKRKNQIPNKKKQKKNKNIKIEIKPKSHETNEKTRKYVKKTSLITKK